MIEREKDCKYKCGADKKAHRVKAFAADPDDLNLVLCTHIE